LFAPHSRSAEAKIDTGFASAKKTTFDVSILRTFVRQDSGARVHNPVETGRELGSEPKK